MRRGRPPQHRPKTDHGTPELQARHAAGHTREPLDRLLQHGHITPEMHRAALHFRWLHTLAFGLPHPISTLARLNERIALRNDAPGWREAREIEYHTLCRALPHGVLSRARRICIEQQEMEITLAKKILEVLHQEIGRHITP